MHNEHVKSAASYVFFVFFLLLLSRFVLIRIHSKLKLLGVPMPRNVYITHPVLIMRSVLDPDPYSMAIGICVRNTVRIQVLKKQLICLNLEIFFSLNSEWHQTKVLSKPLFFKQLCWIRTGIRWPSGSRF